MTWWVDEWMASSFHPSFLCLSLRCDDAQLEGEKGRRSGRKGQLSWSELGKIWPQMGWRCGGHAEFKTQCGIEPCCPTASWSLGLSRLGGSSSSISAQVMSGSPRKETHYPCLPWMGCGGPSPWAELHMVFIVLCLLVFMCFSMSFFPCTKYEWFTVTL